MVSTPTGRPALVVAVDMRAMECDVEWADGEAARFKFKHLAPAD